MNVDEDRVTGTFLMFSLCPFGIMILLVSFLRATWAGFLDLLDLPLYRMPTRSSPRDPRGITGTLTDTIEKGSVKISLFSDVPLTERVDR